MKNDSRIVGRGKAAVWGNFEICAVTGWVLREADRCGVRSVTPGKAQGRSWIGSRELSDWLADLVSPPAWLGAGAQPWPTALLAHGGGVPGEVRDSSPDTEANPEGASAGGYHLKHTP